MAGTAVPGTAVPGMAMQARTPAPQGAEEDNVLEIEDLHVHFHTALGVVRAVNGVNLSVPRGKVLGIVGESGCGKSICSLAAMQLVPHPGRIVSGRIIF